MIRYKVLTLLMTVLKKVRSRLVDGMLRKWRDDRGWEKPPLLKQLYNEPFGLDVSCCDCGLVHKLFAENDCLQVWPLRPIGYDYSLRLD